MVCRAQLIRNSFRRLRGYEAWNYTSGIKPFAHFLLKVLWPKKYIKIQFVTKNLQSSLSWRLTHGRKRKLFPKMLNKHLTEIFTKSLIFFFFLLVIWHRVLCYVITVSKSCAVIDNETTSSDQSVFRIQQICVYNQKYPQSHVDSRVWVCITLKKMFIVHCWLITWFALDKWSRFLNPFVKTKWVHVHHRYGSEEVWTPTMLLALAGSVLVGTWRCSVWGPVTRWGTRNSAG